MNTNINKYYNDDFHQIHKKILAFLNDPGKSGIVLLHGKPGTGKTFYLRYLANLVKKPFIYIPNNLFQGLISPDSLPSLSSVPGNILLLEDAEDILIHRTHQYGSHQGIAQLLNLSDGFIADAFKFKIICTFNCDLNLIDNALLRKGRLVTKYEFKELSKDKVNKILGFEINKPLTLSEVLNYQDENNGFVNKISTLGFSNRIDLSTSI